MSARPSAIVERLRRELLKRPEFSSMPRCPLCDRPTAPAALDRHTGNCVHCEDERKLEYEIRMHAEFHPDGSPKVELRVDDAFDSDKPFLIEDGW